MIWRILPKEKKQPIAPTGPIVHKVHREKGGGEISLAAKGGTGRALSGGGVTMEQGKSIRRLCQALGMALGAGYGGGGMRRKKRTASLLPE